MKGWSANRFGGRDVWQAIYRLASLGSRTLFLILGTSAAAAATGLAAGLPVHHGLGISPNFSGTAAMGPPVEAATVAAVPLVERILAVIPENPVSAFASGDIVAVLFFSVLFGIGIVVSGAKGRAVANVVESAMAIMIQIVGIVRHGAPLLGYVRSR